MSLEKIEEIRKDIKELEDVREINIREARDSISNIRAKYRNLLDVKGEEYCNKNCSDIPVKINKLADELTRYFNQ